MSTVISERKTELINNLDRSRQALNTLLSKLTPADWETQIHDDEKWTVRQIVSHLVDSQRGMIGQMKRIVVGEETVPADFDVNRWNKRSVQKMADKTPEELVKSLNEDHEALKHFIRELDEADFEKRGRHANLSILTVEQFARIVASHEADHTQSIAQKLGK